jgi:hypothetical protein
MHVLYWLPRNMMPEIGINDGTAACTPRRTRARSPGSEGAVRRLGVSRDRIRCRGWKSRCWGVGCCGVAGLTTVRKRQSQDMGHHQASTVRACYPHLDGLSTF